VRPLPSGPLATSRHNLPLFVLSLACLALAPNAKALAKGALLEEGLADLRFASREIPKARVQLAQFYEMTGHKDEAMKEPRTFLPQASDQDRATVERWLSKLAAK
jgi:hypothetical protein